MFRDMDLMPEAERFDYYREVVLTALYKMSAEVAPGTSPLSFKAKLEPKLIADAVAVLCRGTPHTAARTRRDVAVAGAHLYYVFEQLGAAPVVFDDGRGEPLVLAAGDLVVGDADQPFATPAHNAFHHRFWLLPKAAIDPILPGAKVKLARPVHLPGRGGLAALLADYLAAADRECGHPEIAANPAVVANLGHLIGIALGAARATESQRAALAAIRRTQAIDYVERAFSDPEASAAIAAARLGISVRTLHAAFEQTGISFAECLTRRRLQAGRAALANPAARERSVAAIAFACGFNDVGTFHRAFKRIYGMTPSELRPDRGGPVTESGHRPGSYGTSWPTTLPGGA